MHCTRLIQQQRITRSFCACRYLTIGETNRCFIELDTPKLSTDEMEVIERTCNDLIRQGLPMTPRWYSTNDPKLEAVSRAATWMFVDGSPNNFSSDGSIFNNFVGSSYWHLKIKDTIFEKKKRSIGGWNCQSQALLSWIYHLVEFFCGLLQYFSLVINKLHYILAIFLFVWATVQYT